jgi:NAD(P)H dehydrogenase (quinone)
MESTIMNTPRILVLTAAGRTGMPIALQLLDEGFPVTAFVRKKDARSERLKAKGAEIVVGSLTDINDIRKAMAGARRAYFCVPPAEGNLKAAAIFTAVAAEQKLESVVAMSQWLSHPNHPAIHTREVWLADRLLELLPGTAVTFINPGFFVDNDMQVLPIAAQFGLLPLPYGSGFNAPPSNEDMARVAAEILARPEGHAGKTYRPTSSKLVSPQEIAATFTKVLGRKVRYVNIPIGMFLKVMKSMGFSNYTIAVSQQYVTDYQKNAFAVNAPTDDVRTVTGREAEDYETIARRYVSGNPEATPRLATQFKLMLVMLISMLRPTPKTVPSLALHEFSDPTHAVLSADSSEWHQSHNLYKKEPLKEKTQI